MLGFTGYGAGIGADCSCSLIDSLSVTFHGHDIIVDSEMELNYGRRYGLLGLNGCGKSTLLTAIGKRELPIPDHMDIYHLSREIEAADMSSLEAVINCDDERLKLEKEAERLAEQSGEALDRVYERLESLDVATAEKCATEILFGLGFDKNMQAKKTRDSYGIIEYQDVDACIPRCCCTVQGQCRELDKRGRNRTERRCP
ncbi:ABC transporter F family member 1-like [Papaver somniferum]|uniref:ABC transporter F family member 1-like n=1 Tax=Papaver somniferum TaxID=3469 RepID=UPI000E6FD208|nr:ABC transporter F family member 1-like [Papaver somniferum]